MTVQTVKYDSSNLNLALVSQITAFISTPILLRGVSNLGAASCEYKIFPGLVAGAGGVGAGSILPGQCGLRSAPGKHRHKNAHRAQTPRPNSYPCPS